MHRSAIGFHSMPFEAETGGNVKIHFASLIAIVLVTSLVFPAESRAQLESEPGPADGELRMRLLVTPGPAGGEDGYDLRVDLINVSDHPITLNAAWKDDDPGSVRDYIEAGIGIECVPAVAPWSGSVLERPRTLPQPQHLLQAGEVLSVSWKTQGRHLKNRVTDPNEVQNPEFPFPGLYSVHATLDLIVGERIIALRSNEQLVPVGGSEASPKSSFGHLLEVDSGGKVAVLDLGSRHKVEPGDQFMYFSKQTPWKLTLTRVSRGHSLGKIEFLSANTEQLPIPGMGAVLMMKE